MEEGIQRIEGGKEGDGGMNEEKLREKLELSPV